MTSDNLKKAMRCRAGGLAFGTIAGLFVVAILVLYLPAYWVGSLIPHSDAGDYAVTAYHLAHLEPYHLSLLHRTYPSRYPFGFPLLLVPSYWLPHATLANGIYGVLVLAIVTVLATYVLTRAIAGRVAGIVAAITLLLSPAFVTFSHYVMSDIATTALIIPSGLLLHHTVTSESAKGRIGLLAVLGATSGFAILVHLSNVTLPAAILPAILINRRIRADGVCALLTFAIGPCTALLSLMVYAKVTFGRVTATGYQFWRPQWYTSFHTTFALAYAITPHRMQTYGPPTQLGNIGYYAHFFIALIPSRWLYLPLIVGIGVVFFDRCPATHAVTIFALLFSTLTLCLYTFYFAQAIRFLLPLVPFMALAVGVCVTTGITLTRTRMHDSGCRHRVRLTCGIAMCLVPLIAIMLGYPATIDESYLYQRYVRHNSTPLPIPIEAEAMALYERFVPADSILVTDLFVPVLESMSVGKRTIIVPVTWTGYESDVVPLKTLPTLQSERRYVDAAIAAGTPVFTDSVTVGWEGDSLAGFHLLPVAETVRGLNTIVVYRLQL